MLLLLQLMRLDDFKSYMADRDEVNLEKYFQCMSFLDARLIAWSRVTTVVSGQHLHLNCLTCDCVVLHADDSHTCAAPVLLAWASVLNFYGDPRKNETAQHLFMAAQESAVPREEEGPSNCFEVLVGGATAEATQFFLDADMLSRQVAHGR